MGQLIYYTNELPDEKAMLRIHEAMSSLSPEAVANANETGTLPPCDLHYFEVSWIAKRRGVGLVTYIHRFNFPTYPAAQEAQRQFERIMQGNTKDFVDVYYALRIQETQDKVKSVQYNRQRAREWHRYLEESEKESCAVESNKL